MKNREDDDYSFQAIERLMREAKGAPLTETELEKIKKQADEIAELEKECEVAEQAVERTAVKAEVSRLIGAIVVDLQSENTETPEEKPDPFWVWLLAILFLPAVWLHQKTKLSPFVAWFVSSVAILIILFLAGFGICRMLK